jgi:hypothetical protein
MYTGDWARRHVRTRVTYAPVTRLYAPTRVHLGEGAPNPTPMQPRGGVRCDLMENWPVPDDVIGAALSTDEQAREQILGVPPTKVPPAPPTACRSAAPARIPTDRQELSEVLAPWFRSTSRLASSAPRACPCPGSIPFGSVRREPAGALGQFGHPSSEGQFRIHAVSPTCK